MSAESVTPGDFGNMSTATPDVSAAPSEGVSAPPPENASVSAPPAENASVSAPPAENASVSAPPAENASVSAPPAENISVSAPPATTASKRGLSAKAQAVLNGRMATFAEMKEEYKRTFGDNPKAPKAKSYEAFALHKIRTSQGENAYKEKLQEYITRNQEKSGNPPTRKTKKSKKVANYVPYVSNNTGPSNTTQKVNNASNKLMSEAVEAMADSARGLIDKIVSTVKTFAAAKTVEKQNAVANSAVAEANNMGATTKKKKSRGPRKSRKATNFLPPVVEEGFPGSENFNNMPANM